MSTKNCSACNDLNNTSPTLSVFGFDDDMCSALANNKGINASDDNDNCDDLHNMNDCFIGNLDSELDAYEVCDWKTFMHKFIPNLWVTLKAMICAICGLWCYVENLSKPQKNDTLTPDDSRVRYRAADGVKSRYDASDPKPSDAPLRIQVIGGIAKVTGSLHFENPDPVADGGDGNSAKQMPASYTGSDNRLYWREFFKGYFDSNGDYKKGPTLTTTYNRKSHDGNCPSGGLLLYEYEVKACDWGFKKGYDAPLHPSNAGEFLCRICFYEKGYEYPYDCGWDANGNGQIYTPTSDKYDTLIQVRLMYVDTWGIAYKNGNITPNGVCMVKPCTESWDC